MKSELSVEVERPIDEVFTLTTDHVAEWSLTCVEDEVLERKPEGVGTTFRIVTEERGRRMEMTGEVLAEDPPRMSRCRLVGDAFEIDVTYTFDDLDGRTRVTQSSSVKGKGFFSVMLVLFGWLMKGSACKAQKAELESLKKFCEERPQAATA